MIPRASSAQRWYLHVHYGYDLLEVWRIAGLISMSLTRTDSLKVARGLADRRGYFTSMVKASGRPE